LHFEEETTKMGICEGQRRKKEEKEKKESKGKKMCESKKI
jgi:hypothetical protein